MNSPEALWERFIASKSTQSQTLINTQNSQSNSGGILGVRSINNLSGGSIALHADADSAALMRDLSTAPVAVLLSEKSSRELANRSRYVDFVRLLLACLANSSLLSGREKKAEIAVRCIEVSFYKSSSMTFKPPPP